MRRKSGLGAWLILLGLWGGLLLGATGPGDETEVETLQRVIASEKLAWQAGVTRMSSLSREEKRQRLGGRLSEVPVQMPGGRLPAYMVLPVSLDWRSHGGNWITPVKDQGDCGSCWAFATTALLEAMVKISKNMTQDMDLSEQMLVSCSGAGDCAAGGYEYKAAEYIRRTGIPNESCYPYSASDAPCNPCAGWGRRVVRITSWDWVSSSASSIEMALQDGPVTSWMAVYSDLFHYRGGVYQRTSGSTYEGGHFVVIVGYDQAEKYWICKNSWGADWGESGFFRIKWGDSGIGDQVLRMVRPILDNAAPVLQNIPDCSGQEGQALAFTLNASDSDGDPLEYSAENLPEGATLDAGSGAFSWIPTYTQSGIYSIRFKVSDGIAEAAQTAKITVTNVKRLRW